MTGQGSKWQEIEKEKFRAEGGEYGENFKCYSSLKLSEPYLVSFGDNVTVSSEVSFITHDNSVIKLGGGGTDTFGRIKIKDNCFIGAKSIILQGVELGPLTIVGAGSVVTKSFLEGNVVIAGNPAKKICTIEEFKKKNANYIHDLDSIGEMTRREYISNIKKEKLIWKK